METDPFASWYATRIVVDEERQKYIAESLEDDWKNSPVDLAFKPGDFEYFTINHTAGSNEEVQERQIAVDNVESWVDQLTKVCSAPKKELVIEEYSSSRPSGLLGPRELSCRGSRSLSHAYIACLDIPRLLRALSYKCEVPS